MYVCRRYFINLTSKTSESTKRNMTDGGKLIKRSFEKLKAFTAASFCPGGTAVEQKSSGEKRSKNIIHLAAILRTSVQYLCSVDVLQA